ncbi:MAG: ATP-dependent DNA helicase, partial [Pirellula sp.]
MSQLDIHSILGPEGRISKRIKNYEHRREQLEMAAAVEAAFREKHHLVVEAGTGVGKSFGYLVPAILFATEAEGKMERPENNDDTDGPSLRRIVISTHTISLQEQLIAKDIPLLNAVIPREFSSVLVKGRSNYLSKRRLELAVQRSISLFSREEEHEQLERIVDWNQGDSDGSLSMLPFKPSMTIWDEVASDSGNCMGRKCKHHNQCYYFAARRRIKNSQILIVNHALFFSDLALRAQGAGLLPEYDAVVFDESHTIESVAADHMGLQVSNSQIDYTLRKLFNPRTDKGILTALGLKQLLRDSYNCMESLDHLTEDLLSWLASKPNGNGRVYEPLGIETALPKRLAELSEQLERFGKDLKNANDRMELMSASQRLASLAGNLNQWLNQSETESVYWIEKMQTKSMLSKGQVRLTMRSSPIDISSHLKRELFGKVKTVIMTSATLSTGKQTGFGFFQKRVGADNAKSLQVGSPFDYERLAKLEIVADLPDPSVEKQAYESKILPTLRHYISLNDGHAFILFTSYDMLRKVCDSLTPWMESKGLKIYSQASGVPRNQLLDEFKANPKGVLFGAESFWQGVDVPGDALKLVVISKLPFSVPDHP